MSQRRFGGHGEFRRILLHFKEATDRPTGKVRHDLVMGPGVSSSACCPKCGYTFDRLLDLLPIVIHQGTGLQFIPEGDYLRILPAKARP